MNLEKKRNIRDFRTEKKTKIGNSMENEVERCKIVENSVKL